MVALLHYFVPGLVPLQVSRRREFCHFADIPSPPLLKRLLEGEGGAAEWQSRRRLLQVLGDACATCHTPTGQVLSRRQDYCHSAATPSPFSGSFNRDGEGAPAKRQHSRRRLGRRREFCHSAAPPLPLLGVSTGVWRECQQNDSLTEWLQVFVGPVGAAVGGTVILLHPPLSLQFVEDALIYRLAHREARNTHMGAGELRRGHKAPLPLVDVSKETMGECQQNDSFASSRCFNIVLHSTSLNVSM